jgi:tRNA(fMet)-specific endonuclease VapC
VTAICLDTSGYSHFKRGDAAAVTILRRARSIHVPAIVIGELHTGFRLGNRTETNEAELAEFLEHPIVVVAAVDEAVASLYANLMVALKARGTPLPTNDVWIAATAQRHGAVVLTYDEHFAVMPGVEARILRSPSAGAGS